MNKNNPKVKTLLEDIEKNKEKKILIYSLEGCPACKELKTKLDKLGLTYENVAMNGNEEMWDKLKEWGGSEYAPQVKVEDYLIKENEYKDINQLVGRTLTTMLGRKIIIK